MNNDCEQEIERLKAEVGRLERQVKELKQCVEGLKENIGKIMTVAIKLRDEFNKVVSRNGVPRGKYIYCMGGFKSVSYIVDKIAQIMGGVGC